jgi:hypothetical protein
MRVRVLTLIMLAALTLAPIQAWAECAWVLWAGTSGAGPASEPYRSIVYFARGGHETRADCERDRQEQMKNLEQARAARGVMLCLPDTIDPRAPKGSGR